MLFEAPQQPRRIKSRTKAILVMKQLITVIAINHCMIGKVKKLKTLRQDFLWHILLAIISVKLTIAECSTL